MDNTPIYQYAKPTSASLKPLDSSEPVITTGYVMCPCLIKLIRDKSFSGEGNENPYLHLQEFEQIYACLCIAGMSDKTLRWKLFPFSLMGRAKHDIVYPYKVCNEIWKCYAMNFVYVSFPSLKWLAFKKRF